MCSSHRLTVTEATSLVVLLAQLTTLHRYYQVFDLPQPEVFGSLHATDGRRYAAGSEAYDGFGAGLIPIVCKTELLRRVVARGMADPSGAVTIDKGFWDDLVPATRQQWEDAKVRIITSWLVDHIRRITYSVSLRSPTHLFTYILTI